MGEGVDRIKLRRLEPAGRGQPRLKAPAVAHPRTGRWLADPAATEHGRQAARSVVVRVGDATMLLLHARAAAGGFLIP